MQGMKMWKPNLANSTWQKNVKMVNPQPPRDVAVNYMKLKCVWKGTQEDEALGITEMVRAQGGSSAKGDLRRFEGREMPLPPRPPRAEVLILYNEGAEILWAPL